MIIQRFKKLFNSSPVKKIKPDNFIKRIKSLVIGEGMLNDGNIYLMDLALKNLPPNSAVVEIGSYGGLSINLLIHLKNKYKKNALVFSCDPWIYEGYDDYKGTDPKTIDGRKDISRKDYSSYMKNAFVNSVEFLSSEDLPYSFNLTSDDFFSKYRTKNEETDLFGRKVDLGIPIGFAYIDGDHSYDQVKKDFDNVDQFLVINGFILFDDSTDHLNFGSAKFMKEMLKNKNYILVEKNPNYLFKKIY